MSAPALNSSINRRTTTSARSSPARRGSWSCASSNIGSDPSVSTVGAIDSARCKTAEQIKASKDAALHRRAFGFGAAQMLVETRHDLDEIAGTVTVVELVQKDLVPRVAAGAGRARQAEDVGAAGNASGRARLDRRGADLGLADQQEHRGEALHALLEQRLDRLPRHVAAGEAGAAGGDD